MLINSLNVQFTCVGVCLLFISYSRSVQYSIYPQYIYSRGIYCTVCTEALHFPSAVICSVNMTLKTVTQETCLLGVVMLYCQFRRDSQNGILTCICSFSKYFRISLSDTQPHTLALFITVLSELPFLQQSFEFLYSGLQFRNL